MATLSVRSTYSLDVETMGRIENLARRWDVSKSEVLRRAIRMADEQAVMSERVEAYRRLQGSMHLTAAQADAWIAEIRAERDAWTIPGGDE